MNLQKEINFDKIIFIVFLFCGAMILLPNNKNLNTFTYNNSNTRIFTNVVIGGDIIGSPTVITSVPTAVKPISIPKPTNLTTNIKTTNSITNTNTFKTNSIINTNK